MLHSMRDVYERATLPLGHLSLRLGLRPDFWTYFSLLLGLVTAWVLAQGSLWGGLAMVLLVDVTDAFDGATARAGGTASRFGGILDHVADRYAEFLILGGLLLGGLAAPWLVLWAISGMIMASYVRAAAESIGRLASAAVGFAGRQEKLILLMVGLVVEGLRPGLGALGWALFLIGLLSHITAVQRMVYTRRQLLEQPLRE
jgi:CDP-diacylglycerol--glycerol-3-phosphate 3-phosphatidyltransferase/archaetidylinositol phosphate synthase